MKIDPISQRRTIEAEASQWVVRKQSGLDETEGRQFETWLDERSEHREAYERLRAMSEVFQRVRESGSANSVVSELGARSRKRRARRRLVVLGAASAIALGAFLNLRPILKLAVHAPEVASAQFEPIRRLPDGSIVELKDGAEIIVKFDSAYRRVSLERGEALFRVEHDLSRPFIVSAKGVEVRAVGTAFNVKLDAATVDVLVTEGKVRVDDSLQGLTLLAPAPNQQILLFAGAVEPVLVAGQEAVVDVDSSRARAPARVVQLGSDEISRTLSWRIPRFDFDGVGLGDAVQRINRMNRVQIVIADSSLVGLRLSGTFSPDDPETFTRLVAATFSLRIERRGEDSILLFRH